MSPAPSGAARQNSSPELRLLNVGFYPQIKTRSSSDDTRKKRMVTVTRSTLSQNLSWFIRSLVANNVSDPKARGDPKLWIYKGTPQSEYKTTDLPRIVINTEYATVPFDVNAWRRMPIEATCEIEIRALRIGDRDTLTDSIVALLGDETKVDLDGVSQATNHIQTREMGVQNDDEYAESPSILYGSFITARIIFNGT